MRTLLRHLGHGAAAQEAFCLGRQSTSRPDLQQHLLGGSDKINPDEHVIVSAKPGELIQRQFAGFCFSGENAPEESRSGGVAGQGLRHTYGVPTASGRRSPQEKQIDVCAVFLPRHVGALQIGACS